MKLNAKNEKKLVTDILIKLRNPRKPSRYSCTSYSRCRFKSYFHGIGRFSQYIKGFKAKTINLEGDIDIERETEAMALINGNSLFGQYVARRAMDLAIRKS